MFGRRQKQSPFPTEQKKRFKPANSWHLVGKAHRAASINPASDRVQIDLNRLGSDWFAAGKSDLRQHASLRDDVERHVSRHAAVKV